MMIIINNLRTIICSIAYKWPILHEYDLLKYFNSISFYIKRIYIYLRNIISVLPKNICYIIKILSLNITKKKSCVVQFLKSSYYVRGDMARVHKGSRILRNCPLLCGSVPVCLKISRDEELSRLFKFVFNRLKYVQFISAYLTQMKSYFFR